MTWIQDYQPAGGLWLSALLAALPIIVLLVSLGVIRFSAHLSAALALVTALGVALLLYRMPAALAFDSAAMGIVFGVWSVAWIAFHAVYFHNVTVATGRFDAIKRVLAGFSEDRRLQALLIAFSFGALLEGVAGGGSPIAITAAMMAALGFPPVKAVVLALLANTAPVAFGGLGNPLIVLGRLTAPIMHLKQDQATELFSAAVGRQVPLLALIIPAFLVVVLAGWKRMLEVWPAVLTAGLAFAVMQFVASNYISASLVDVLAALTAMAALWILTRFWQPATVWRFDGEEATPAKSLGAAQAERGALYAWMPYIILILAIFLSRIGTIFKNLPTWLDLTKLLHKADWVFAWPGLHNHVVQHPPITAKNAPYAATLTVDFLFSPGTVALIAAVIAGFAMGGRANLLLTTYAKTLHQMRWALATIFMILAIAFVMNYSGATQTLGLALATTGVVFPLFSAYIGWLGVFLTGSDASTNSLFGPMQVISAQQLGLNPILAGATNTSGGVMGKMISPQNLSIGATAIGQSGKEGSLLRQTFLWSLLLTAVVGVISLLQATILTALIPSP
ncbi:MULTISPECIES: lactate permease LctP family transporter [unclassified Amycolatopsis]|uniref:L-lactate permease n=1 Tax=unclassified Amycolatopsis TaxID=2618356 RepID=UPI002875E2C2|nr:MULTISPECIES: lactate permease LctP family transporter [unclassified Amycolatopsis]MDS0133543.1 lactate permease LctP family transporter [Amycolatopsis sp. 505]MDS0146773.1 lactate permease LctP family transporter [Amycolatopsis sp. CM201R]